MRRIVLAVTVLIITTSGTLSAQTRDGLIGTWRLVSASATTGKGRNNARYGSNPTGLLTYTREGRMAVIISHSGRKPLSRGDRISASAEERAEAFATFFAYAGRYTLSGDQVSHHVEISSVENRVNTDLIRLIKLEGKRLILRTPPISVGEVVQTTELTWERVKK